MASSGSTPFDTREHNRRLVLQALRRHGTLSRAGRRRGGRGQPPLDLSIDPLGGVTLGIELRHDGLVGLLADLEGAELETRSVALKSADPASVARALPDLVARLTRAAPRRRTGPLFGIGIVGPGPFGLGPQVAGERRTELPGWAGLAARFLADALDQPVAMENDAAAAALAEHLYGAGRSLQRIACLYLGRGLGMGLVLDGRLYRGATGNAGEIGHVVVEPGGRACFCGQRGCLERYASLDAALDELGLDDAEALERAKGLARWLDAAAARLAIAVLTIENLFDPDAIVVAGLSRVLVVGLVARLQDLPAPLVARRHPRVIQGASGPFSAARGAAALPLYGREAPHLATRAAGTA
jgi:predicted NBD/HSP70 family sugar kinase